MVKSSTPEEHAGSPITIAGAMLDVAAASPDMDTKRRLFGDAWRIALPQLRALARRALNGDTGDLLDDTLTYTAQKTWRSVQTGYTPNGGYESLLPTNPSKAAWTVLERSKKHRDNPMVHFDHLRDMDEDDERGNWLAVHDEDFDAVESGDTNRGLQQRLVRACHRAMMLQRPIAAIVLLHGIDDRDKDTANRLNITPKELRVAVAWIREEHYALLTASDTRFREYLEETVGLTMAVGA